MGFCEMAKSVPVGQSMELTARYRDILPYFSYFSAPSFRLALEKPSSTAQTRAIPVCGAQRVDVG
jgi:hypothetical protein